MTVTAKAKARSAEKEAEAKAEAKEAVVRDENAHTVISVNFVIRKHYVRTGNIYSPAGPIFRDK
jgi:hypothetical protein